MIIIGMFARRGRVACRAVLPVGLRIEGCLSEKDWVLLRCNAELVVECVML